MTIIFDEYKYALRLIDNGFSSFLNKRDLFILAKYYRYGGLSDGEIYDEIIKFCIKFNSQFNEVRSSDRIDAIIKFSRKYELKFFAPIAITQQELKNIRNAKNYRHEKILFVMLVLNKHFKRELEDKDRPNFINFNFTDIFKLAKVYVNSNEKFNILHDLALKKFIEPVLPHAKFKANNKNNLKIFFRENDFESNILITDESCIISFYPFYCEICGKTIKKNSNRQKMCDECYKLKKNY
jgi:hypothetical protein